MNKKTLRDVNVKNKRVLVRVDFNVPLENGKVTDDTRIVASLPTIKYLVAQGAKVILCSHLGRPKGKDEKLSLRPVATRLQQLLGKPVTFVSDCIGQPVERVVEAMNAGDVVLLENVRFYPEEEKNDLEFAKKVAAPGDVYVNDAFGSAHRAHASTEGVTKYLPAVAGFLMEKELNYLGTALANPANPFVAILGGAKVSDKIKVIENLLPKVDSLLIGGGMANTFLAAKGLNMGQSLVEADKLEVAKARMAKGGAKIVLPVDAVIADKFAADAQSKVVAVDQIPGEWRMLDIGPRTIDAFEKILGRAKTVVWNGPLGVFEFPAFAKGTVEIAKRLATSGAITIIGGGDSAAAVEQAGVADKMTHISTGGGASLEFLEGRVLPGVAALQDK
ncbi:MAG: phosphoglycerate kinase [Chloroflexota bacterium]|nr:phosphoglycerate kinase [Chloroflexota bacterium]